MVALSVEAIKIVQLSLRAIISNGEYTNLLRKNP